MIGLNENKNNNLIWDNYEHNNQFLLHMKNQLGGTLLEILDSQGRAIFWNSLFEMMR